MSYLVKIFFFFALLPFISPYPIGTDIQPISLLLAAAIVFVDVFYNKVRLGKFDIYFLLFSLFSFLFIGFTGSFDPRHRVGLLFAFLIYYCVKKYSHYLTGNIIKAVVTIHFFGVIWHFISPQSFMFFAEFIVREIKISDFTSRGASGFAAENSFAAALSLVHILIIIFLNKKNRLTRTSVIVLAFMSLIVILLSQSGLGYIYTILLFAVGFLTKSKLQYKVATLLGVIILLPILFNSQFVQSRGGVLLVTLIENPEYIFLDGSLAERWVGLHVGTVTMSHYPFGVGGGTYSDTAAEMVSRYNLRSVYPAARASTFDDTVSATGRYMAEFGIFFIIFLIWIIYESFTFRLFPVLACMLGFLLIFTSFSITFPPTYLLLGLACIDKKEKKLNSINNYVWDNRRD